MMKINKTTFVALALAATSLTSCIEEVDPQSSTVTIDQAASAPNSFNKFVSAKKPPPPSRYEWSPNDVL